MGQFILPNDLAPFATIDPAKAEAMIDDAEAMAVLTAPCLPDLLTVPPDESTADFTRRVAKIAALKAILRAAIVRWDEAGAGGVATTSNNMGPFSESTTVDTRVQRRALFWPSEISDLQSLCTGAGEGKAFAIDTAPACGTTHLPWCSASLGAAYCSCGADIAGYPIFEGA